MQKLYADLTHRTELLSHRPHRFHTSSRICRQNYSIVKKKGKENTSEPYPIRPAHVQLYFTVLVMQTHTLITIHNMGVSQHSVEINTIGYFVFWGNLLQVQHFFQVWFLSPICHHSCKSESLLPVTAIIYQDVTIGLLSHFCHDYQRISKELRSSSSNAIFSF